jgi:hypothetical protein
MSLIFRTDFHSDRRNQAIQRLKDAGLTVGSPGSTYVQSTIVNSRDDSPKLIRLVSKSISSPVAVDYWSDEWSWILSHWGGLIPGPGLDDFQCELATIEEAVEKILVYYFGEPTIIGDWVFPLHLHPELPVDRVQTALSQASILTEKQFEAIQSERRAHFLRELEKTRIPLEEWWREVRALAADELRGKEQLEQVRIVCEMEDAGKLPGRPKPTPFPRYDWALQSQFLHVHHISETSTTFRLRRDLEEAYVVSIA